MCGGSINIARNNSKKGFHSLNHFVNKISNTNVILDAPNRYDLAAFLCVNEEVKVFNSRLYKLLKIQKHVQIKNMGTYREHYITHGLHMNRSGKDWSVHNLARLIKKIFLLN